MPREDFFKGIKSKDDLYNELKKKGIDHDQYSFYGDRKSIVETLKKSSIRLTRGTSWNDIIDRDNLCNDGKIRFVKSFTYSKSENIAMWMLYSDPSEEGFMLTFTKSIIKDLITKTNEINISRDDTFVLNIPKGKFRIEMIDVIYVGDDNKNLILKKSIYGLKNASINDFPFDIQNGKLDYYAKLYGWAYENECRLVIEIDKANLSQEQLELLDDECYIDLAIDCEKNDPKVVLSPNCSEDNPISQEDIRMKYKLIKSKYKEKLNWSLREKYSKYLNNKIN